MYLSVLLLTPVYITIFWAVVLFLGAGKHEKPRKFLGLFMFFAFLVYFSHFLYFSGQQELYYYIDPVYQLASLLIYPFYYIYLRIVLIDSKFNLSKHYKYLVVPVTLFLIYVLFYFLSDKSNVLEWLYSADFKIIPSIAPVLYVRYLIGICFIGQIVLISIADKYIIRKYLVDQCAENVPNVLKLKSKIKTLSWLFNFAAVLSIIISLIGKSNFQGNILALSVLSFLFSAILFSIGWIGLRQKPIEKEAVQSTDTKVEEGSEPEENIIPETQQKIVQKLLYLFRESKIYLNCKLTINDVANEIGTNRTYLSSLINQQFSSNFCTFVNEFRIYELKNLIIIHPDWSNQLLSENCGFGSVDSMKRAVASKYGITFLDWKKQTIVKILSEN